MSAYVDVSNASKLIPQNNFTPKPVMDPKSSSVHLLGIHFNRVTMAETLALAKQFIAERKKSHQICLSNAYTVSLSWDDGELRNVLDSADLVLADGMSIVWGGRLIGVNLPGRIAGPDLAEVLCADAERSGLKVFFLGSTVENLAALKQVLLEKWPRLQIVGMYSPPMCQKLGADDNNAIFKELHATKPDILFVGMSTPKQEKWIAANLDQLDVPVSIGIGAAFDFMSGRIPRAPEQFQKMGMEWLYRLWCEPRRLWRRYLLGNMIFLAHLAWSWIRVHSRSKAKAH
jgi:N-acetylglucosaminyldiphosphoundecaprenol N-acetyl-beta-D-mannosaminyltransferase